MNEARPHDFLRPTRRASSFAFLLLLLAFGMAACGGSAPANDGETAANNTAAVAASPASGAGGASSDAAKFDAEIARLEKQAEKSPGDEDVRGALSQAYLRRADALRSARQFREALRDYQSALRNNPDNEEAQQRVAELSSQVETQATGENGEPAPLPITPNVTTDDDAASSSANNARPASSPKSKVQSPKSN